MPRPQRSRSWSTSSAEHGSAGRLLAATELAGTGTPEVIARAAGFGETPSAAHGDQDRPMSGLELGGTLERTAHRAIECLAVDRLGVG